MAAIAPNTKSRESPGKKGVTTKPVSQKIMTNMIKYVHAPYWAVMEDM